MNYSNMIEEKNLKKSFIIATLVSTVIGTFTAGVGLYERLSAQRKQKKTDKTQDERIRDLQDQLRASDEMIRQNKQNIKAAIREENMQNSLQMGGPMIRREYNRDMARFGNRFAEGDAITQNQLQGQIITLQSTVIKILENALQNNSLTERDMLRLYNASELAREGSLGALQSQFQRMLQAAPIPRQRRPKMGGMRRSSSVPTLKSLPAPAAPEPPRSRKPGKASEMVIGEEIEQGDDDGFDSSGDLFCRYGLDLQDDPRQELEACFVERSGSMRCPVCRHSLDLEPGRAWKITKTIVREDAARSDYHDDDMAEERVFLASNRFVIKSHRQFGGFACILCARYRDVDTICESAQGLIRHVWQRHGMEEYGKDVDIRLVS